MLTLETLQISLNSLGYTNLKKLSGTRIAVLTNDNRVSVLEDIQKKIKGSVFDTTPSSVSSVGMVKIDKFSILAKPASKQGTASAGVDNEYILVNTINKFCSTGAMNIKFKGKNKTFELLGIIEAKAVGGDTAGRKKADIVVKDKAGKVYPISIKKSNAEVWESADSFYGTKAQQYIEKAVKEMKTVLSPQPGGFFTIEPNIAVKASLQETRDVVFGSDLENGGAVITKTFTSNSFKLVDDVIEIECDHVITELKDVKDDKEVYFLIRNDKTRKSIKKYPGIRVLASYKKRINKNIVIVK